MLFKRAPKQPPIERPTATPDEEASAANLRAYRIEYEALNALLCVIRTPCPIEPSDQFKRELKFLIANCNDKLK